MNQRHHASKSDRTHRGSLSRLILTLFLIIIGARPGASSAQAAAPGAVVAWGYDYYGETKVPMAARSGVTAIAAGRAYTVALKNDGSVLAWGFGTNYYG